MADVDLSALEGAVKYQMFYIVNANHEYYDGGKGVGDAPTFGDMRFAVPMDAAELRAEVEGRKRWPAGTRVVPAAG